MHLVRCRRMVVHAVHLNFYCIGAFIRSQGYERCSRLSEIVACAYACIITVITSNRQHKRASESPIYNPSLRHPARSHLLRQRGYIVVNECPIKHKMLKWIYLLKFYLKRLSSRIIKASTGNSHSSTSTVLEEWESGRDRSNGAMF